MQKITPILGAAGLALFALTGQAQQFQYSNGDLILDVSRSGYPDLEVDLGSLSSLTSRAQANGGTVQLNAYSTTGQLLATFGNVNGLTFSVFGTQASATPSLVTDYVTLKRVNPSVQNNAPNDLTSSGTSSLSSGIKGIIGVGTATGILPWSANNPADPVGNTANVAIIPTSGASSANSFTVKNSGANAALGADPNPVGNTTPANFSSGSIVSDLFEYDPLGGTHKTVYQGDFTFNSDGTLDFTTAFTSAPEPSTYGLAAAGGLLLVSLRHQFRRKQTS
jgi:hypothetical protein